MLGSETYTFFFFFHPSRHLRYCSINSRKVREIWDLLGPENWDRLGGIEGSSPERQLGHVGITSLVPNRSPDLTLPKGVLTTLTSLLLLLIHVRGYNNSGNKEFESINCRVVSRIQHKNGVWKQRINHGAISFSKPQLIPTFNNFDRQNNSLHYTDLFQLNQTKLWRWTGCQRVYPSKGLRKIHRYVSHKSSSPLTTNVYFPICSWSHSS